MSQGERIRKLEAENRRLRARALTKVQIAKLKHDAWSDGVQRAIDRLERLAEEHANTNVRLADGYRDAAEKLEGILRRGR